MIQCTSCGTTATNAAAAKCERCGADLHPAGNGGTMAASAGVGDETVAMPLSDLSRPRSGSTTSRFITTSVPEEEGRFVPGSLVAGRYRIIALLGRGGMGEVYRATDLTLGQSVALKFLPDEAAGNERLLERFHGEVRIARQVSHANVCRVYDIGEADGVPFMSMEYVDGEDLGCLLQRIGRLPSDKALEMARKLCAGLAAAHERGIIHRDLKPQNVMLNKRGEVIIMDFGLAAVADELQGAEARNGTPAYMAPEQLRGDSVTPKSDLYSLGLIVYELFTGRRAFAEAKSAAELLRLEETSRPPSITTVAPEVDPAVEKVIARCLNPDPLHRPASALSIAAALPGGDPLAAALAAGETPSPELVAASGKAEGFAPRYAIPCLVFSLAVLAALPFATQSLSLLAVTPMDYTPPVLEQKARDIAAAAGYPKPADWASWLYVNNEPGSWFEKHRGKTSWRQIFSAVPAVEYAYRQSPDYLLAPPDEGLAWDRPAPTFPGMVGAVLDSRGHLRYFEAVAPRYDEKNAPPAVDPAAIFRDAGLDIAQFHEVTPQYAPPLAFDARHAWAGTWPGLANVPVTIELATYRGAMTSFFIHWPWTKPPSPSRAQSLGQLALSLVPVVMLTFGLLCAAYYARQNIRRGRGDRQGAFRLALVSMVLFTVASTTSFHFVPRLNVIGYAMTNAGFGLLLAAFFWLVYMALEPALRARWPHSLITWNRLLAGNVRDPRVNSHVLIGITVAMAFSLLFIWRTYWGVLGGGMPVALDDINILRGVLPIINRLSNMMFNALLAGAAIFFLLSGVRGLLRRDWLAAIAAAAIMCLMEGNVRNSTNLALDLPLFFFLYGMFAFILLRMGLVPAVVSLFVLNVYGLIPVSADYTAWYNWVTALLLALLAGMTVYAFWRSQAAPSVSRGMPPTMR